MHIFDNSDFDRFFNPFCCRNKKIYYECILLLIEKSKQVSLLYENDAKNALILYFRNLTYAVEDEVNNDDAEESISSGKTETENASAVLRYFRHCGWLSEKELGRNGDNIAAVMPYCRKMIESIEHIFNRDNSAALTNHIFAIYDILHSAFVTDHGRTIRPYSNILVPVSDGISDLKNELLILKDSIRSIMKVIIKLTETNELGQFLIRDEMMERFFNDYFFIKKDGLIPGYIEEIENMLRQISNTEVYAKMIEEYHELNDVSELQAREIIEAQFSKIKSFISYDYVKEMDYIDKKINNYYNLYTTRILMVMAGNINMQSYLNNLLMYMKDIDKSKRNELISDLSKSYLQCTYKYVGRKSIERRKKRRPNIKSAIVINSSLTEEERKRLTDELLHEQQDRYGVKQATKYFDEIFDENNIFIPGDNNIKTREDAMMIVASIIYSGSGEFPYRVEFTDGMIETEVASIRGLKIIRKENNG